VLWGLAGSLQVVAKWWKETENDIVSKVSKGDVKLFSQLLFFQQQQQQQQQQRMMSLPQQFGKRLAPWGIAGVRSPILTTKYQLQILQL
jgi:hypothetical protein